MRVEHEYDRGGAQQYLAAWDCDHAKLFGRCEPNTGIAAFDRLVHQVMTTFPYAKARRVFWIVDNSSSQLREMAIRRVRGTVPKRAADPLVPACFLAQPGGDLLRACPAQSPDPQ
jgi:hypothetical protein